LRSGGSIGPAPSAVDYAMVSEGNDGGVFITPCVPTPIVVRPPHGIS